MVLGANPSVTCEGGSVKAGDVPVIQPTVSATLVVCSNYRPHEY